MQDFMELMGLLGGKSTPPAMGGPTPPNGTPYPLGMMGANNTTMAALAGIGMMNAMSEYRKLTKAQNSVGMELPKPTQTSPMASGIGPADLQQRGAQVAGQQSPQGPPPGMPPGGGGMAPPPGGMPPGMLAAMLAQRMGGGGM